MRKSLWELREEQGGQSEGQEGGGESSLYIAKVVFITWDKGVPQSKYIGDLCCANSRKYSSAWPKFTRQPVYANQLNMQCVITQVRIISANDIINFQGDVCGRGIPAKL